MAKKAEKCFVVIFPLRTSPYQADVLNTRLEIGRRIYNCMVKKTKTAYFEMTKTKQYRQIMQELVLIYKSGSKVNEARKKELHKELNNMYRAAGFTEYGFHKMVKPYQHYYSKHIDSNTSQKIGTRLWTAWSKVLFSDGEDVRFKKFGEFNSLEGKSNASGIRIIGDTLIWNKLRLEMKVDWNNPYEAAAMDHKIAFTRVLRKWVNGKEKFYAQIVFQGTPPAKISKETGEFKRLIGSGRVGLDIGTQTLGISSSSSVRLVELADGIQNIEREKRLLLRKLDRSRRSMNPGNYNEDGTIKKQGSKKVVWVKSNRYVNTQLKLRAIQSKQAEVRMLQHHILANEILALGNEFYVEKMNFKALQKRAKKTEISEKTGKVKRKKRFGKSLANKAPSKFLTILKNKVTSAGGSYNEIDTFSARASQYNHLEDDYTKKKLSERWSLVGEHKIQRDIYSSFLLMNIGKNMKTIDKKLCDETFQNFLKLHDQEIEKLKKNPIKLSSTGIKKAA